VADEYSTVAHGGGVLIIKIQSPDRYIALLYFLRPLRVGFQGTPSQFLLLLQLAINIVSST
jgi:hypothetical protein